MNLRYFEDLQIGEALKSHAHKVNKQEILTWAQQYDPQYFHIDEQAAEKSVFKGLIAPGIFTLAIWRQLDHSINGTVSFVCGTGWDQVRWPTSVRPGDTLTATSKIIKKSDHVSNPKWGNVLYQYELFNQDNHMVLSFLSHNLVEKSH